MKASLPASHSGSSPSRDVPPGENEESRLAAVHQLASSPPSKEILTRLVEVARRTFDVEAAALNLVGWERQWPIATAGRQVPSTPRTKSPCALPILNDDVTVIQDVLGNDQLSEPPTVATEMNLRFYAGAPVSLENEGLSVGALSLYGTTGQDFSPTHRKILHSLATVAGEVLAMPDESRLPNDLISVLQDVNEAVLITEGAPVDPPGPNIVWANEAFTKLTGYQCEDILGKTRRVLHGPETNREREAQIWNAMEAEEPVQIELTNYRKDGEPYVAVVDLAPVFNANGDVAYWISFHHDVTDRRKHENELRYKATHDSLTGLANRTALQEELETRLDCQPDTTALLYLDLDRFKLVNDSLGHSKGDELLVKIAGVLQEKTRSHDLVARVGGDEFAVVLSQLDYPEEACQVAIEIYEALNRPIQLGERTVFTPASIGIVGELSTYDTAEDILRDADTAMYEAKDNINQPFAMYEEAMTRKVEEQLSLDAEVREGLERDEFEPFFQPIVNLRDGSLRGFDVLARWRHSQKGILEPDAFLEAAEVTGLIVPIGHQVIRKACKIGSRLEDVRGHSFSLSLNANFSRQEFVRAETYSFLTEILEEYDVSPGDFTMEISERTIADVSEKDISAFTILKELGLDIILVDFGTGFSSLQSLRHLPVDGLKIDKELLTEANDTSWDRELVDLVVQMGHTLDKTVIAEGIEREPQLHALREMGCTAGQGFLFARPVPAHEIEVLLDEKPWMSFWTD